MTLIKKSDKLNGVCYDIRGPVLEHAYRLEEEGHRILKLNIGNPAPFGFAAPAEIIEDVIWVKESSETLERYVSRGTNRRRISRDQG